MTKTVKGAAKKRVKRILPRFKSKNSALLSERVKDRGAKIALARKLELSPSTITRIAGGYIKPGLDLRFRLEELFGYKLREWEKGDG